MATLLVSTRVLLAALVLLFGPLRPVLLSGLVLLLGVLLFVTAGRWVWLGSSAPPPTPTFSLVLLVQFKLVQIPAEKEDSCQVQTPMTISFK